MLKKVSNSVVIKKSNVILTGGGKSKSVPAINTLVSVSVVGKEENSYRILVDGSLFQSKLPFFAEKGESFLAKVISLQPFALTLDGLTLTNEIDQNVISAMITKLGFNDNKFAQKAFNFAVKDKKPLIKSKLKRVIEYLTSENNLFDDIQLSLLLNIIWNTSEENGSEFLSSFSKIFDLSFEELSGSILNKIERLNSIDNENEIVKKINQAVVYQIDKPGAASNILSVTDKSKNFVELSKMIDRCNCYGQLKMELKNIQSLMLKYILQKSMFNMFGTFPEFIIAKSSHTLEMIIVRYDKIQNSNGELLYQISTGFRLDNLGDFNFLSFLSSSKLNGDLALDYKNLKNAEGKLNLFNEQLSSLLKVDSSIRIYPIEKFVNIKRKHPNGMNSINTTV